MDSHQHFIGGHWVPGEASIQVINPSDGQAMAGNGAAWTPRPAGACCCACPS